MNEKRWKAKRDYSRNKETKAVTEIKQIIFQLIYKLFNNQTKSQKDIKDFNSTVEREQPSDNYLSAFF